MPLDDPDKVCVATPLSQTREDLESQDSIVNWQKGTVWDRELEHTVDYEEVSPRSEWNWWCSRCNEKHGNDPESLRKHLKAAQRAARREKLDKALACLEKGIVYVLWPIMKAWSGIMYIQQRWEEFFWTAIDSEKRRKKHEKKASQDSTHLSDLTEATTSNSHSTRQASSPAEEALQESRCTFSHLTMAHEINLQSPP